MLKVLTAQSFLEGHDVLTHVLSEHSKTMLPHVSGPSGLEVQLQVSESQWEEARELLEELTAGEASQDDEAVRTERARAAAHDLGRSAFIWAVALPPLGLFLASVYFVHEREAGEPLPDRGRVRVAWWFALVFTILPLGLVVYFTA